jgi:endonuclease I
LRRKGAAVTDVPADGQVYDKGAGIGNSKVFYVGDMTNFEVREMAAGTEYHFAVFSYNGFGSYINYNTAMPLLSSQTSAANGIGTYYNGIDTNQSTFVTDLTTLVNNHNIIFYSDYKQTMIDQFLARDTTGDQFVVNCEYSNEYKVYSPPFDFTLLDASREHRFASSWMPTFGSASHDSRYAYADQHDLALVNQTQVNAVRNNEPFGEVVNASSTFGESSRGTDANGTTVFEVRDAFKGDVARAVLYMSVAYHNAPNDATQGSPVTNSWAWDDLTVPGSIGQPDVPLSQYQDIDLLMDWHMQDPPSAEEIARNDFIHDNQGNRNPFVDHPEWLCQIDFTDMSKKSCGAVGLNDISFLQREMTVVPNPNYGEFTLSFTSEMEGQANLRLVDLSGKEVFVSNRTVEAGMNNIPVQAKLSAGMYILEVELNGLSGYRKIQVR